MHSSEQQDLRDAPCLISSSLDCMHIVIHKTRVKWVVLRSEVSVDLWVDPTQALHRCL